MGEPTPTHLRAAHKKADARVSDSNMQAAVTINPRRTDPTEAPHETQELDDWWSAQLLSKRGTFLSFSSQSASTRPPPPVNSAEIVAEALDGSIRPSRSVAQPCTGARLIRSFVDGSRALTCFLTVARILTPHFTRCGANVRAEGSWPVGDLPSRLWFCRVSGGDWVTAVPENLILAYFLTCDSWSEMPRNRIYPRFLVISRKAASESG